MTSAPPAPLDLTHPSLHLTLSSTSYTILRLPSSSPIPAPVLSLLASPSAPSFLSLTRTPAEHSLIYSSSLVLPPSALPSETSGPWSLLRLAGPLDLSLTGILLRLLEPLSKAGVAIFASSTYDTDYVLIMEDKKADARRALEGAGWIFD